MISSLLRTIAPEAAELLEIPIKGQYPPRIDLSIQSRRASGHRLEDRTALGAYVAQCLAEAQAEVVWGGYLEQRMIYAASPIFHLERHPRNIHLGIDFWGVAGLRVHAPLEATVHSFQDNDAFGDYGPTIILRHEVQGAVFHSLYGHLARKNLSGLEVGQSVAKGQAIGNLGEYEENGNWPPHLHFQLIVDMEGRTGDYPGVCAVEDLKHYTANCPDPRFLLGI